MGAQPTRVRGQGGPLFRGHYSRSRQRRPAFRNRDAPISSPKPQYFLPKLGRNLIPEAEWNFGCFPEAAWNFGCFPEAAWRFGRLDLFLAGLGWIRLYYNYEGCVFSDRPHPSVKHEQRLHGAPSPAPGAYRHTAAGGWGPMPIRGTRFSGRVGRDEVRELRIPRRSTPPRFVFRCAVNFGEPCDVRVPPTGETPWRHMRVRRAEGGR